MYNGFGTAMERGDILGCTHDICQRDVFILGFGLFTDLIVTTKCWISADSCSLKKYKCSCSDISVLKENNSFISTAGTFSRSQHLFLQSPLFRPQEPGAKKRSEGEISATKTAVIKR